LLAECDDPEAEADVLGGLEAEARALADLLAAELLAAELLVAERAVEEPPPAGDGVRVAGCVVAPDDADVSGDGVKVDGTEDPPPVQAETAIASRAPPAARRPAVSHAFRVAAGVLSRIFMDPPRTRVRYTR
jgi:hypothetical protein